MARRGTRTRGGRRLEEEFNLDRYVPGQTLPTAPSRRELADWFLSFLRTDIAKLAPVERLAMSANASVFARPELIDEATWTPGEPPPFELVERLQVQARKGVERLQAGDPYTTLERGIRYSIARIGQALIRVDRRGTFPDLFHAAAMEVLLEYWGELRQCPHCHGLFVRNRKQRYCSAACGARTHWERFKPRRAPRDHYAEYQKRVQQRIGPNVKATRRTK